MTSTPKSFRPWLPSVAMPHWNRLKSNPLAYRLAKGAFWSLAGAVISRVLMLLVSVVTARVLGKAPFGELGMIQSTIGLFGTFAGFGLGLTATRYVAEFRNSDRPKTGRIIGLSGIVALLTGCIGAGGLALFADWLAVHALGAPQLGRLLRIGSLLLLLTAMNGAQTGVLAGFEAFKTIAWVNVWTGLAAFPLMLIGLKFGGLQGMVWGLVASAFVNCLLNHSALRREASKGGIPLRIAGCLQERRILWGFALPATLSGFLVAPIYWACNLVIVGQPGGYEEMGIFSAASQWKNAILFIPGALVQLVLPILSSLRGEKSFKNQARVLFVNMLLNACVCLVPAIIIAMSATVILAAYGQSFGSGVAALRFLSFSAVLNATISVIGQFIASSEKMWWGFFLNSFWAVSMLGFTLLFKKHGATGLAMADFFSYCVHLLTVSSFALWQFRLLQRLQFNNELLEKRRLGNYPV